MARLGSRTFGTFVLMNLHGEGFKESGEDVGFSAAVMSIFFAADAVVTTGSEYKRTSLIP